MRIEELKDKKIHYQSLSQNKGFRSRQIIDLLSDQALNNKEIVKEIGFASHKHINSTLIKLRKSGKIIAFYIDGEREQRYTQSKNAKKLKITPNEIETKLKFEVNEIGDAEIKPEFSVPKFEQRIDMPLTGNQRMILFHINKGKNWPSQISGELKSQTMRVQEEIHSLEKKALVFMPKRGYYEITEKGKKVLIENSIQKVD